MKEHNDRAWFAANKGRYEDAIKSPALDFIEAFERPLRAISPHFVADTRGVGGSLFRIHRDTRFSKDKTPYKTHTGIQFRHEAANDVHAPGFYLHLEPGFVMLAAGVWHPDNPSLAKIRAAIDEDPAEWKRVSRGKRLRERFALVGDSLKRPPAGYAADHPLIEDLKRRDFIVSAELTERDATTPGFDALVARELKRAAPFVAFLCRALALRF